MDKHLFTWFFVAFAFTNVCADDAIEATGKKHRGELALDADNWSFQTADAKIVPLSRIAYIRFELSQPPLPNAPLTHTLQLPQQQRIAGMLRNVDAKTVEFVTSWGKTIHLDRARIVGIEQARNARILLHDDLDQSLQAWQLEGIPQLDRERAFHGAASLLLDQPKQSATRNWKPALTDGDIRLYFYDPATAGNARSTFHLLTDGSKQSIATLVIDEHAYACERQRGTFGFLKRATGWHLLTLELRAGRLRTYVDDSCLGEIKPPAKDTIKGLRISSNSGKLWIDELIVTQRLPALAQPVPLKDSDTLWLTHGEQLFAQLIKADRHTATLDSKLGKRAMSWSQLRGIYFAQHQAPIDPVDPEITFRPGPGFPLDKLRAKLLRWEEGKLIVQHELFGEIALERSRLDTIRLLAK